VLPLAAWRPPPSRKRRKLVLKDQGAPVDRLAVAIAPGGVRHRGFAGAGVAARVRAVRPLAGGGVAGEPAGIGQEEAGEDEREDRNEEQTAPLHGLTPCPRDLARLAPGPPSAAGGRG